MSFFLILIGFILLILGGNWLLKSAVSISLGLKIPKIIIGMTVVSFATSAPELIVSINSAVNGYPDLEEKPDFVDRFDLKARFSANIGNVIGLPKNMDIYPGLNLGLRNFGGHTGFRYFFTEGFGVFCETGFPIAKYDQNIYGFDKLNNQFTFTLGASFNLQ